MVGSVLPDPAEIPLTGEVRADLLALLGCVRDTLALTHGAVFQTVRNEAEEPGGLLHDAVGGRVMEPCRELIAEVLGTAGGAGSPLLATVGPAMLVHYAVHSGPSAPDDYLASVVDELLLPLIAGIDRAKG